MPPHEESQTTSGLGEEPLPGAQGEANISTKPELR